MRICHYVVTISLITHVMVAVDPNFDAGVVFDF
jgi:hypothetical protein